MRIVGLIAIAAVFTIAARTLPQPVEASETVAPLAHSQINIRLHSVEGVPAGYRAKLLIEKTAMTADQIQFRDFRLSGEAGALCFQAAPPTFEPSPSPESIAATIVFLGRDCLDSIPEGSRVTLVGHVATADQAPPQPFDLRLDGMRR